jgi:hypothetical protein
MAEEAGWFSFERLEVYHFAVEFYRLVKRSSLGFHQTLKMMRSNSAVLRNRSFETFAKVQENSEEQKRIGSTGWRCAQQKNLEEPSKS